MKQLLSSLLLFLFLASCKEKRTVADSSLLTDPGIVHNNVDQLTRVIIYDVFNPPVASRIYAYTSLAAYEALRHADHGYPSITAQLHGFPPMPEPDKGKSYNYLLASTRAFFTVAEKITFSVDTLKKYENKVFADFRSLLDDSTFMLSMKFGEDIGDAVLQRTKVDNYQKTRGMSKYLGSNEHGQWRPTPPDYLDGSEPYWSLILPLAMDSAFQFRPAPPPLYKDDTSSDFYKVVYEVYNVGKNLTEEQKTIARYWDDNPFVIEHSGHMMFGNKKITPVGHWIGITTIACKKKKTSVIESCQAYALTATAMFDGFINCWAEKFRSHMIRPVSVINEIIDQNWQPFLQTPPFPEHTSGHSTISAAAATVLTNHFGDNFSFEDTSDLQYIGMRRNFQSFLQAAMEASISRVYGGIHYRTAVEEGTKQGIKIGELINSSIRTKDNTAQLH